MIEPGNGEDGGEIRPPCVRVLRVCPGGLWWLVLSGCFSGGTSLVCPTGCQKVKPRSALRRVACNSAGQAHFHAHCTDPPPLVFQYQRWPALTLPPSVFWSGPMGFRSTECPASDIGERLRDRQRTTLSSARRPRERVRVRGGRPGGRTTDSSRHRGHQPRWAIPILAIQPPRARR